MRNIFKGKWLVLAAGGLGAFVLFRAHPRQPGGAMPGGRASLEPAPTAEGIATRQLLVPLAYLVAVAAAESITAWSEPPVGVGLHAIILFALLLHAAMIPDSPLHRLLVAVSLAPLIRMLSLAMPLEDVDLAYWYAIIGVPMLLAAFVAARLLGLSREELGLTLHHLPLQAAVALTGVAFGLAEYFILRPDPLIDELSWRAALLPAVILLVGTGFNEEFVFRGVMQSASKEALGRWSIIYVSAVFAALHLGYQSALDVVFVFAVALFFAMVVTRTKCLLGVTLSHGITNISLYLVIPFLGIG